MPKNIHFKILEKFRSDLKVLLHAHTNLNDFSDSEYPAFQIRNQIENFIQELLKINN